MAAVTYRCPVDPDTCHQSAEPGYCPRHQERMERIRPRFPQPAEPPAEPASPRPEASPHTGGAGARAAAVPTAGVPTTEARIPVRWSVRVLGRDLAVPSSGALVVGREQEPFASLPGMAEQVYVSRRRHAQLYRVGDTLRLVDLGSTNGTFLDGMPVTEEVVARDGQPVSFGRPPGGLVAVVVCGTVELDEWGLPR